jgi:hypothetical protein
LRNKVKRVKSKEKREKIKEYGIEEKYYRKKNKEKRG